MENTELHKLAAEIRTKAEGHKNDLELYLEEIKTSGRNVTEEDEEKMQGIKVNLLTELNRHTKIYKMIYADR